MKKQLLAIALMLGVSGVYAGSFGDSFFGSFLGSTTSNIVTQPRHRTVVVQDGDSRNVRRLKRELSNLEDKVDKLTDENNDLRRKNDDLRRKLRSRSSKF